MLILELEPELESSLNIEAQRQNCTVNDIVKKLIYSHFNQKQESQLLVDVLNGLPEFPSLRDIDPLALQREWRNEWE
jgi:hypothetical protein